MADFEGNMLRPPPTAASVTMMPFGPITETNLQDGLEEMTPMLYAAQVMAATLFGAL